MSKVIKFAEQEIEKACEEFRRMLTSAKLSDGKINYTKTMQSVDKKAVLFISERAQLKMEALVNGFDKEVAWHGIAYRDDDPNKNDYYISDIIVYPQVVSAATVNTDQEEYQNWLYALDDLTFNHVRMQGHSHVNMGTTPSAVDESLYDRILDQLDDDMFYIFMILNKKGDRTIKIYDLRSNTFFGTTDVTVEIEEGDAGIYSFVREARGLVSDKKATTTSVPTTGIAIANKPEPVPQKEDAEKTKAGYGGKVGVSGYNVGKRRTDLDSYDDYSDLEYYRRLYGC